MRIARQSSFPGSQRRSCARTGAAAARRRRTRGNARRNRRRGIQRTVRGSAVASAVPEASAGRAYISHRVLLAFSTTRAAAAGGREAKQPGRWAILCPRHNLQRVNHTALPTLSVTTITPSVRGPCTPRIRVISMSAVAEGPEIVVTRAGWRAARRRIASGTV